MQGQTLIRILLGMSILFNLILPAQAEHSKSLTFHTGVQKSDMQEPGIVGLDMLIAKNQYPLVKRVFKGSPAHIKGILPGDYILEINGFSTLGMNAIEIDRMISDVPGTPLSLKVQRGFLSANVYMTVQSLSYVSNRVRSQYSNVMFDSYDNFTP
jgi:C-terminal processing protease CtpA/Prc